jgi:hypothetical protein
MDGRAKEDDSKNERRVNRKVRNGTKWNKMEQDGMDFLMI